MKKSFKKVVAILLAVMMIVCSVPLTVFAAGDANRANINLQFGDVSCTTTKKTVIKPRDAKMADYLTHSGLNSDKLIYSNGKIDGYATGDFFTVSVLLENVTELSAAEVAIKYSEAIEPAYIKNYQGRGNNVTVAYMYNEVTTEGPHADFPINGAIPTQSGSALYNSTSTLGETSYVDPEARIMHANFAVQTGADSVSLTDSKAVLATFMFKIVNDQPITFSIDNTQGDPYETYTLGTIANGGKVEEYKTYAKVSEADVPALDFMGENEYNGTVGKNYTITFVNAEGQQISSAEYKEGTAIVPPSLPATTHDDAQHYTYAWDKEIPATATANGTYTIIKTGAAHTWDAGVVTTEPTTTTTGVKTYTCTFDGCGATRTEELPKVEETHVHTWSEWTYNNDAVYVSKTDYKDGTATRKCTDPDCPEHATETKTIAGTGLLRASSASAVLGASVGLNAGLQITRANPFDKVYAVFEYQGKEYPVDEFTLNQTKTSRNYTFDKIGPKNFGETVKITMYGVKDGITCKGHSVSYSIKTYLYQQIRKNPKANAMKLYVETLYFAEADQRYNGITSGFITDELEDKYKAIHTQDVPTYTNLTLKEENPNPTNADCNWRTLSLVFSGAVYVRYKIDIPVNSNISDYDFHFVLDGKEFVINQADGENEDCFTTATKPNQGYKSYYVLFKNMSAHQYSLPIKAYVTNKAGEQASNKVTYSGESFAFSADYKNKAPTRELVDQMLRYGRANIAYRANPNA